MDGGILFVGVAFLGGIFWEVMSLVNVAKDTNRKLNSIESQLGEIESQLANVDSIYGEIEWHKDLSSVAQILKHLKAIESAIQELDISR